MREPYEIVVRGRESAERERFASLTAAELRAEVLAEELGREVRVYDLRLGMLAAPVYAVRS